MRLVKCLLMLLFSCLIISCSLIKTSYNNAPALSIWWLDDYFNFNSAQNLVLKPALQKLHAWHRKTQLPQVIVLMQDIQTSLANNNIGATEACEKIDKVKSIAQILQVESIPIIIEMAPLLSDKQLQYFQQQLVKRTEKWKADWWQETKEEQLAARLEKTQDFAENLYGDLSESQIDLLKQSLAEMRLNPVTRYSEIQRRNEDAYQILKQLQNQSLTQEEKAHLVKAGFERMQKSPDQAYVAYVDVMTKHTCKMIAELHASTTVKQKLHAKNWLEDYIMQFINLQTT